MLKFFNPFYQLRRLYDWVMTWSEHRHSVKALAVFGASEAVFFPIPADVLLIAMGAARPKKSLWYATVLTFWSVTGGLLGYAIGWGFWVATQDFFFAYVFSEELFQYVVTLFQDNAFWAIFTAGFTPIPYKVFTIAAGVGNLLIPTFILASFLSRGLRFFAIGLLLYYFGESIRVFIERYFNWLAIVFTVLVISGFYFLKYCI